MALARSLAPEPALVLLDEPFSSLDATLRADLRREVELILREAGATALLVTHDQEEALALGDRLAVMRGGELMQIGRPEDVYARPAERWTAQFVGDVNVLSGPADGTSVRTELGVIDLSAPATGTVHVAVRPEQFEVSAGQAPNAEVVDREFRGHDALYRLRHEGGRMLLVQLPVARAVRGRRPGARAPGGGDRRARGGLGSAHEALRLLRLSQGRPDHRAAPAAIRAATRTWR